MQTQTPPKFFESCYGSKYNDQFGTSRYICCYFMILPHSNFSMLTKHIFTDKKQDLYAHTHKHTI